MSWPMEACCFGAGETCVHLHDICCSSQGGWRSGLPVCLGDVNGDGYDDACVWCLIANPPLDDYSPVPPDAGSGTKNRYLTFSGGDEGRQQAARVTFVSLPPPFDYATGRTMWVQEPDLVTEASGSDQSVPPPSFWAATLGCNPYYTYWIQYDRVDVYDAGILPDGTYHVQLIDSTCSTLNEGDYSDPLTVLLSEVGDVVGAAPDPAPQGTVDFVDIAAVVSKFKNDPGSIRKARADITNANLATANPDQKVDFVDISCVVGAFRADPCAIVGPPTTDPCDGP